MQEEKDLVKALNGIFQILDAYQSLWREFASQSEPKLPEKLVFIPDEWKDDFYVKENETALNNIYFAKESLEKTLVETLIANIYDKDFLYKVVHAIFDKYEDPEFQRYVEFMEGQNE